jgi:hypothetical protein
MLADIVSDLHADDLHKLSRMLAESIELATVVGRRATRSVHLLAIVNSERVRRASQVIQHGGQAKILALRAPTVH